MKDPVHQTIPTNVFCPGKNEANPYMVPNDLQEADKKDPKTTPKQMKLSLCPPFSLGGDNNLFHRIILGFPSMNFCGNSLKFELRCYTYLQNNIMHFRLPLTIYLLLTGLVSYIQEK